MKPTKTRFAPFGRVSDGLLEDKRLTPTARLIGAWFQGRPRAWKFRAEHICRTLGVSRGAWQRARLQLIKKGYIIAIPRRENGRILGFEYEFVTAPETTSTAAVISSHEEARLEKPGQLTVGITTSGIQGWNQQPPTTNQMVVEVNDDEMQVEARLQLSKTPLIFPTKLEVAQADACRRTLSKLSLERQQVLLDELSGRLDGPVPVRNPLGYIRTLVVLELQGTFTPELAIGVAIARKARELDQARQQASPPGPADIGSGGKIDAEVSILSSETQVLRADLRARRQRWK